VGVFLDSLFGSQLRKGVKEGGTGKTPMGGTLMFMRKKEMGGKREQYIPFRMGGEELKRGTEGGTAILSKKLREERICPIPVKNRSRRKKVGGAR